jgi:hypothetical protein
LLTFWCQDKKVSGVWGKAPFQTKLKRMYHLRPKN